MKKTVQGFTKLYVKDVIRNTMGTVGRRSKLGLVNTFLILDERF